MAKRLKDVLETFIVKHGRAGMVQLCASVDRSERTLDRWIKTGAPNAHDAYKLALACGLAEDDALLIAKDSSSSRAKDTA